MQEASKEERQITKLQRWFGGNKRCAVSLHQACQHILQYGVLKALYLVHMRPLSLRLLVSIDVDEDQDSPPYYFFVLACQNLTIVKAKDKSMQAVGEKWINLGYPLLRISEERHGFNHTDMPSSFFRYMANTRPLDPLTGFPYESSTLVLCYNLPVVAIDQPYDTPQILFDSCTKWVFPLREFTDRYIYDYPDYE